MRFAPILAALSASATTGGRRVEPFDYVPDGPGAAAFAIGYLRGVREALGSARGEPLTTEPTVRLAGSPATGRSRWQLERLGLIMHGVTGRMGMNQHLIRSIVAIRAAGRRGACQRRPRDARSDPDRPQRREDRGARARARHRPLGHRTSTQALADRNDSVFFDAGTTQMRPTLLAQALRAGKHVYCEKPIATNLDRGDRDRAPGRGLGAQARRGRRTSCSCRACASSTCCAAPASSAACCRCGSSSATGSSRATCSRSSGRRGTTAPRTAAA